MVRQFRKVTQKHVFDLIMDKLRYNPFGLIYKIPEYKWCCYVVVVDKGDTEPTQVTFYTSIPSNRRKRTRNTAVKVIKLPVCVLNSGVDWYKKLV